MNRLVSGLVERNAAHAVENAIDSARSTAATIRKKADEKVVMSRQTLNLKIAVALLGGLVLGMLISPRKKVSYKIASENHDIGGGEFSVNKPGCDNYDDESDEDFDEDDDCNDCCGKNKHGKFIKL